MKKLFFNKNNFIVKNNFSKALKKEIRGMFYGYFNNTYNIPLDFKAFDKEISNLIIKLQDEEDTKKRIERKKLKNIRKIKHITVKGNWTGKKFFR